MIFLSLINFFRSGCASGKKQYGDIHHGSIIFPNLPPPPTEYKGQKCSVFMPLEIGRELKYFNFEFTVDDVIIGKK